MTIHVEGTDPYRWPYDGRLAGDHLAVVLAGWDVGWSARTVRDPLAEHHIHELTTAVSDCGGLVVVAAHAGAAVLPVGPGVPNAVVTAPRTDAFYASALDDLLRTHGRTHLLVAGHGIEGAVHSTLRSANDRGYECLLVTDACTSLTTELTVAAAFMVTMSGGIFGAIGTTGPVLAALAGPDPHHDHVPEPDPVLHPVSTPPLEARQ